MDEPLPEDAFDLEEILADLERWVAISSPTTDPEGVNRMMDEAQRAMERIEARIERHPGRQGFGDVIVARLPWGERGPWSPRPLPPRHRPCARGVRA